MLKNLKTDERIILMIVLPATVVWAFALAFFF